MQPELRAEGHSRLTYELGKLGDSVKLTVIHEVDRPGSKLIEAVSGGWPHILASLKSLLGTGEPLEGTRHWRRESDLLARAKCGTCPRPMRRPE